MTTNEGTLEAGAADTEDTHRDLERLQDDIEQTRAEMSATISAIETKLNPSEVRDKVGVELKHVEERVREVVQEQLGDAKKLVQAELLEAKNLLREEMDAAEDKIKRGLGEARDAVKQDLKDAVSGAKHAVRAATLGKVEDLATSIGDKMTETRDTLIDTVRQNPIPATIMGVGLVWLLMNRSKSSSTQRLESSSAALSNSVGHALGGAGSAVSRAAQGATDVASKAWQQTADAAGGAAHAVSDTASSLAHSAGDTASHLVDQAGEAASSVAAGAKSGVKRVEQGFHTQLNDNPMALGAAVLAIGAVVGYALPRTEREDSLMGETRDRMLEQAGGVAHDAATSAAHLAEQALASVTKSADSAASSSS